MRCLPLPKIVSHQRSNWPSLVAAHGRDRPSVVSLTTQRQDMRARHDFADEHLWVPVEGSSSGRAIISADAANSGIVWRNVALGYCCKAR